MFLFLILIINFSFFLFKEKISNLYFLCENYKNFLIKYQNGYEVLNNKYKIIYKVRYNFYTCLKVGNASFCCQNITNTNTKAIYDDILDICLIDITNISEKFILR